MLSYHRQYRPTKEAWAAKGLDGNPSRRFAFLDLITFGRRCQGIFFYGGINWQEHELEVRLCDVAAHTWYNDRCALCYDLRGGGTSLDDPGIDWVTPFVTYNTKCLQCTSCSTDYVLPAGQ